MSLNISGQGGTLGVNCVPTRGRFEIQDGPAHLYFTVDTTHDRTLSGMVGLHIDRPSTLAQPHGVGFDMDGLAIWTMGVDADVAQLPWPDLVLANTLHFGISADYIRMRADDARLIIGQAIGHPTDAGQVTINGGNNSGSPIDPLFLRVFGTGSNHIMLHQDNAGSHRRSIEYEGAYRLGTDLAAANTSEFGLWSVTAGAYIWSALPAGDLQFGGSSGTAGQALVSNGTGASPSWQTVAVSSAASIGRPKYTSDADMTVPANLTGNMVLIVGTQATTLTATRKCILPDVDGKVYMITNLTAGAQAITVTTASGTGPTIAGSRSAIVYCVGGSGYIRVTPDTVQT